MNILHKSLLVAAAVATFGTQSASAGTFASAILDINNFKISHGNGTVYKNTDFSKLIGVNDAHATASLNNQYKTLSAVGSRPDVAHQCVGSCSALGENNFAPDNFLVPMSGNFGYADQNFQGAAISVNGAAAGAHSQTRADMATTQNMQFGNSNSSVGSSNTMSFRLGVSDTMTVSFDATAFAMAYSSPDSRPTTTANARISWSVNIVDLFTGASIFTYAPEQLNGMATVSRTHGNNGMSLYTYMNDAGTPFSQISPLLLANRDYQITVQHNTLVSVLQQEVPEPGSLGIVGAGLFAMALGRRHHTRRQLPGQ